MEETNPLEKLANLVFSGEFKREALEIAEQIESNWYRLDVTAMNLSLEELAEADNARGYALAIIASAFLWNGKKEKAMVLEPTFINNRALWRKGNRAVIEVWLTHLLYTGQTDLLKQYFIGDPDFRKEFLVFNDLFMSGVSGSYEFESKDFIDYVNHVNHYGHKAYGEFYLKR